MSAKPGNVCKLVKGKLIDAQAGFVDTFNWLVDFASNMRGESPIQVVGGDSGAPVVKYKAKDVKVDEDGETTEEVDPYTPTPGPVENLDEEEETGTDKQVVRHLTYNPSTHQLVVTYGDNRQEVVFTATPVSGS